MSLNANWQAVALTRRRVGVSVACCSNCRPRKPLAGHAASTAPICQPAHGSPLGNAARRISIVSRWRPHPHCAAARTITMLHSLCRRCEAITRKASVWGSLELHQPRHCSSCSRVAPSVRHVSMCTCIAAGSDWWDRQRAPPSSFRRHRRSTKPRAHNDHAARACCAAVETSSRVTMRISRHWKQARVAARGEPSRCMCKLARLSALPADAACIARR